MIFCYFMYIVSAHKLENLQFEISTCSCTTWLWIGIAIFMRLVSETLKSCLEIAGLLPQGILLSCKRHHQSCPYLIQSFHKHFLPQEWIHFVKTLKVLETPSFLQSHQWHDFFKCLNAKFPPVGFMSSIIQWHLMQRSS